MEREAKELESSIIDLSGSLSAAKAERDRQKQNDAPGTDRKTASRLNTH
jgi:hypothetical protein